MDHLWKRVTADAHRSCCGECGDITPASPLTVARKFDIIVLERSTEKAISSTIVKAGYY